MLSGVKTQCGPRTSECKEGFTKDAKRVCSPVLERTRKECKEKATCPGNAFWEPENVFFETENDLGSRKTNICSGARVSPFGEPKKKKENENC